jgi:hypothetical protein
MRNQLTPILGVALLIVSVETMTAQDKAPAATAQDKAPAATVELTGCVSLTPSANGQFAFVDASGGTYRLNGKDVKKYAGQRVRLVGDPRSKRIQVRTGLWPSPNIAAQAGALDPAQESIARHSGGTNMPDARAPELRVVRMNGIDGACQ